jgi:hypothetical protein
MSTASVSEALAARAERAADQPFFHCGGAGNPWLTPGELQARSARLAGGLVLQQRLVISDSSGVVGFAGGGLAAAAPV